jgi:anti-anti-sigma factor
MMYEEARMPLIIKKQYDSHGAVLFRVEGELDLTEVARVKSALLPEIQPVARIVIDLSGVTYLDSAGIGILIGLHRKAQGQDASLRVAAPSTGVARILKIIALNRFLHVYPTVQEALAPQPPLA